MHVRDVSQLLCVYILQKRSRHKPKRVYLRPSSRHILRDLGLLDSSNLISASQLPSDASSEI